MSRRARQHAGGSRRAASTAAVEEKVEVMTVRYGATIAWTKGGLNGQHAGYMAVERSTVFRVKKTTQPFVGCQDCDDAATNRVVKFFKNLLRCR